MILTSLGHWLTEHPEYAEWGVAFGTLVLAVATFVVARQARSEVEEVKRQAGISAAQVEISAAQVDVSRAALEAQVRPLLIDAVGTPEGRQELVRYDRATEMYVGVGDVHVAQTPTGMFVCSVSLRNAGHGLAIISDDPRLDHPARETIGRLTTQLVPPGELTRAFFAPGIPLNTSEDAELSVKVTYSDSSGKNTYWTKLAVRQRDHVWRVVQVQIGAGDEEEPMVTSAAAV